METKKAKGRLKVAIMLVALITVILLLLLFLITTVRDIFREQKIEGIQNEVLQISDTIANSFTGGELAYLEHYKYINENILASVPTQLDYYFKEVDFPVYIDEIIRAYEESRENQVDGMSADDVEVDLEGVNHIDLDSGDYDVVELGVSQDMLSLYTVGKEQIKKDEHGQYIPYSDLTFIDGEALFEYKNITLPVLRSEVPYMRSELTNLKGYNFVRTGVHLNANMLTIQYISTSHLLNIKWYLEDTTVDKMVIEVNNK